MSLLAHLLLISAAALPAAAPSQPPPPRGGVAVVVRVQAEVLRAERAAPEAGAGRLERQVMRLRDGQMLVEFD